MVRIASYNVENLFDRPKALNPLDWSIGKPILAAYNKVSDILNKTKYTDADKQKILEYFVELDLYFINDQGAVKRKYSRSPKWAWLRKNRGHFDREPSDPTKDMVIIAEGREDWIGWVELAKEPTDDSAVRMTARVIKDVGADIIGIVEADNRPSLVRFNDDMLDEMYGHIMLIDGNDTRGIDVGIMADEKYEIETVHSNVDLTDNTGIVFSRDCPEYRVRIPNGPDIYILINHFKSQSGGSGSTKRQRQAAAVRKIANKLTGEGEHVIIMGDLNEGPATEGQQAENLTKLFDNNSPLVDCYSLDGFETGNRPGSYNSCGLRNRFDYILLSKSLIPHFTGGGVFRMGLWGDRKTRPDKWETYPEMTESSEQASDHAVVYVDLNL